MKVNIKDDRTCKMCDLGDDDWLVVYKGQLCIREARPDYGLFTIYGEMVDNISRETKVSRIKSISVELA